MTNDEERLDRIEAAVEALGGVLEDALLTVQTGWTKNKLEPLRKRVAAIRTDLRR